MEELISSRLVKLRKHFGERLGHDLTIAEMADKCGTEDYKIQRLESGLKGTTHTLVVLLNFYREQGYNVDWIIAEDNSRMPMMVPESNELLHLSEELTEMSQNLERDHTKLNNRLRSLGYQPKVTSEQESEVPEAAGLLL